MLRAAQGLFPSDWARPPAVAAGRTPARVLVQVTGEGPRARWADVCRPPCIIQLVNCSGPVTAERAIEPRGVIIYDEARRCLPGAGMGCTLHGDGRQIELQFSAPQSLLRATKRRCAGVSSLMNACSSRRRPHLTASAPRQAPLCFPSPSRTPPQTPSLESWRGLARGQVAWVQNPL